MSDLSLEVYRLKKTAIPMPRDGVGTSGVHGGWQGEACPGECAGRPTRHEIQAPRRENNELKQLVSDLSLEVYRLKKTAIPMSAKQQKATILSAVASSTLPKRQALRDLGVPKSTYYRWLNRHRLDDRPGGGPTPWNRLSPAEEQAVLTAARQSVELSCRQLAAWFTDSKGFSVSESYQILN